MKYRITEGAVMLSSIIKWFLLSTGVGAIVGFSTAAFVTTLNWSEVFGERHSYYFLLLPFALVVSAALVKYLAPDAEGHGTEKVIEAVHQHSGKIKAMVVPVKVLATIITMAAGGSIGKEGPAAQIGAGISSVIAGLFKFNNTDQKKLIICGISAGFAAVFGTPIGGAIFGVEVLIIGGIMYDVLLPSFIAGLTAYEVTSSLGIHYFHRTISFAPVISEGMLLKVVAAGIFFGFFSILLVESLGLFERMASKIPLRTPYKGVVGGTALVVMTFLFSGRYLGLGLSTVESALSGDHITWYAPLAKAVFTSITLSFGGSGGIVTPIFFIGSTAGSLFASLFGQNLAVFSAIGLVSVLAGTTNTPIASSIIAIELFGPTIAPYAAAASIISFLMSGHRSVYPSQVIAMGKSPSIKVEKGLAIQYARPEFRPRDKTFTMACVKILKNNKRYGIQERKNRSESPNKN